MAAKVEAGVDVLLLPLGATEQHGPHLAIGTDSLRAAALAERVAARVPEVLLAPTLPYGASDEHGAFPGLLGLSSAGLAEVLVALCRRAQWWRIRAVAALSAHGGNADALRAAAARVASEVPHLDLWILGRGAREAARAVAAADGLSPAAQGTHAGEQETSEVWALRPAWHRSERRVAGARPRPGRPGPRGLVEQAPNGVLGDPRGASAERGGRYLEAQAEAVVRELRARLEGRAQGRTGEAGEPGDPPRTP